MKYIKSFEEKNNVEYLRSLLNENPLNNTHDFYLFIGHEEFKEMDNGMYKKYTDIENMVRITPDENSLAAASFLSMRAMVQPNSKIYHIWLPNDIRKDVEGKSSRSIEPWIHELIEKYKRTGSDEQGKRIAKDVKHRLNDIDSFNI